MPEPNAPITREQLHRKLDQALDKWRKEERFGSILIKSKSGEIMGLEVVSQLNGRELQSWEP